MIKAPTFTLDEVNKTLTEKQMLFCLLYVQDKQCFGNASLSYERAYDLPKTTAKKYARQAGYKLVTNNYIKAYINKMLLERFKNLPVDREHSKLIMQDSNLFVKMTAIQEYNKIKKRTEESPIGKIEFSWRGDNRKNKAPKAQKTPTIETNVIKHPKTPRGKFIVEINN